MLSSSYAHDIQNGAVTSNTMLSRSFTTHWAFSHCFRMTLFVLCFPSSRGEIESLHSQSVYINICQWMSQFIKSMIECSTFSFITMIEHSGSSTTQTYTVHTIARALSQFNLYAKWKERSQNKYYCLLFSFFSLKNEEDDEDEGENNTRKVDNWFSILWFSLSRSLFPWVCMLLARYGSVSSFTWLLFASVTTLLMNLIVVQFVVLFSHWVRMESIRVWVFILCVCCAVSVLLSCPLHSYFHCLYFYYYFYFVLFVNWFFGSIALICLNCTTCVCVWFPHRWFLTQTFTEIFISVDSFTQVADLALLLYKHKYKPPRVRENVFVWVCVGGRTACEHFFWWTF